MGLGSFLKKVGGFVGDAVSQPVRGLGRIARGKFSEGFGDLLSGGLKAGAIAIPGLGAVAPGVLSGALGSIGGALGNVGGLSGALGSVGGFLKNNAEPILSGINMIQGARSQGRSDDLLNQALQRVRERDQQVAPLRDMVVAGLQNPGQREDLGGIFAGSSNPFARPIARPATAAADPGQPSPNIGRRPVKRFISDADTSGEEN